MHCICVTSSNHRVKWPTEDMNLKKKGGKKLGNSKSALNLLLLSLSGLGTISWFSSVKKGKSVDSYAVRCYEDSQNYLIHIFWQQ